MVACTEEIKYHQNKMWFVSQMYIRCGRLQGHKGSEKREKKKKREADYAIKPQANYSGDNRTAKVEEKIKPTKRGRKSLYRKIERTRNGKEGRIEIRSRNHDGSDKRNSRKFEQEIY